MKLSTDRFAAVTPRSLLRATVLLLPACALLLAPALPLAAADGPSDQRQVVQRSPSSGSASSTRGSSVSSSGGSAASTRGSVSRSGPAGRTRPGGGSGRGVAVRSPGSGSGHGGHGHHGYFPHYYGYFGFGYYGYPYFGYYPYYSHYPYYPRPVWYYAPVTSSLGALELKVKPKRADVYIDGQRIGRVGEFDGYPGFLWLEKGTYDLVVYLPGYQTFHQEVQIRPGVVIEVRERLVAGESIPPEEISPPPSEEELAEMEGAAVSGTEDRPGLEGVPRQGAAPSDGLLEPGRLHLAVEPLDASVYLDGRFLGTGEELAKLRSGLMVNPGEHHISVVRPTYDAAELQVEVAAGEDLDLAIRLRQE